MTSSYTLFNPSCPTRSTNDARVLSGARALPRTAPSVVRAPLLPRRLAEHVAALRVMKRTKGFSA